MQVSYQETFKKLLKHNENLPKLFSNVPSGPKQNLNLKDGYKLEFFFVRAVIKHRKNAVTPSSQ